MREYKIKNMAIITEKALIIESRADLEAEMCRYNCQTKEDLETILESMYNVKLIISYEHIVQKCNSSIRRVV